MSRVYLLTRTLALFILVCLNGCGGGGSSSGNDGGGTLTDTTPNAFSFDAQTDVEPASVMTSNSITVSGINAPASISISGADGEYSIDGGSFTNASGTITNGQSVVVRVTSANDFSATTETTLTIGGVSGVFSVTTRAADNTPDAFTFTDQNDVEKATQVTSNAISVSGIELPVDISISGGDGEYAIDGGSFTNAAGTVSNGQTVVVRLTSANEFSTATETTLTIGGMSDTFTVTTRDMDTTPDAFSFAAVEDVALNEVTTSDYVTIQGIEGPAPISISGESAEYQIEGGAFTNTAGTIDNGQSVRVRLIAAEEPATTKVATLTIGGISAEFQVTTTRWTTAEVISNNPDESAFSPQIAVDALGNGIAVWDENDGTRTRIWVNRFDGTTNTWGTPLVVSQSGDNYSFDPQIATDALGNAIVVWRTINSIGGTDVWTSRYSADSNTWGTPAPLETGNESLAPEAQIAMDAAGNAILVWQQRSLSIDNIVSRRFDAVAGTWGSTKLLENSDGLATLPLVTLLPNGDAMAVWRQWQGSYIHSYANRHHLSTDSWETPILIESFTDTTAYPVKIASDELGNVLVIMKRELEGYSSKYYSNYYNNSSGTWSGTYQFSDSLHDGVEHANLVADSNGEFIATWQEFSASETYLKEGRYNPASNSWSTRQINTDTSRGYYSLDLAKDDNDNLLLVGDRDSSLLGIVDMEVRLYDAETGTWGAPKLLEQSNFYVRDPHVAFGGNNHAIVIWRQYNGSKYDLWSARYIGQ